MLRKRPIVAITMGDPAGIGPEVVLKALLDPEVQRVARLLVCGNQAILKEAQRLTKTESLGLHPIEKVADAVFQPDAIDLFDLGEVTPASVTLGKGSKLTGKASVQFLEKAIDLAMKGEVDAIATGPINKEAIHQAGYRFAGHTELLAKKTGSKDATMLFAGDHFWVVLATPHLPIDKVSKHLDKKKILKCIQLAHETFRSLGRPKPRIGVAGLNPHAGEGGLFGKEDKKIILPAVEEAKRQGLNVKGPMAPDAIFYLASTGMFDVVVAMYHDQGLIPLKLLSFNRSVNVTVGLPIVRTSVDHGTGYGIAGKGWANPGSMIEAIKLAARLALRKDKTHSGR